MDLDPAILGSIVAAMITAATPLLFAALGEVVTEKSGVLNLGVEGMMLIGAVCGFAAGHLTGNFAVGVIASAVAGAVLAGLFGFLVLHLLTNQVATGLALTLFGIGVSSLIGQSFVGIPMPKPGPVPFPFLSDIPFVGPAFFRHDALVYIGVIAVFALKYYLERTRSGLILRAVGENHTAAHALGYRVLTIRMGAILFGGAMAGIGGGYLSLAYTPMWAEGLTAGRGWIALALVVFATWRPVRVAVGALLFGGLTILQLYIQGLGVNIPSPVMSMVPYLATILVLVLISRDATRIRLNAPACLGKVFHPDA